MNQRVRYKRDQGTLTVSGVYCSQPARGELLIGSEPDEVMGFGELRSGHRGKIVFTGAMLTRDLRIKGGVIGVAGFLAGGMHYQDLREGKVPICLSEGLGKLPVGADLWPVLKEFAGQEINFTQGKTKEVAKVKPGDRVRLIGDPGPLASQGEIVSEVMERSLFPGPKLVVVKVELRGKSIEVPVANLELISC